MNKQRLFIRAEGLLILLAAFLVTSCEWEWEPGSYYSFDYKLQGTWESVDKSVYSGGLIITYNTFKIVGYYENQTNFGHPPSNRPFREFSKDIPFKGYSEDGRIFIEHRGMIQSMPYFYYSYNYGHDERLEFYFGNRKEELKKIK